MSKRLYENDELHEAEVMLAFHLRKAEKMRARLEKLRAEEEHRSLLRRLQVSKQLRLRADDSRLAQLVLDFRLGNPGLLLVKLPVNPPEQKAEAYDGNEDDGSAPLVMGPPAEVVLRVLSAEQSIAHWLGPYDTLVPLTQKTVMGDFGEGSWWSTAGEENLDDDAEERGQLCEDAWKQLYAEYSAKDGLWYCKESAFVKVT